MRLGHRVRLDRTPARGSPGRGPPVQMATGPADRPVQRVFEWVPRPSAEQNNMADPLLVLTDFGTTYAVVNGHDIPGTNATTVFTPPAFRVQPIEGGRVRLGVFSDPINRVGYRMELPSAPPWRKTTSVDHAVSALGKAADAVKKDLPAGDTQITVEARGLPSDGAFAKLVEQHELKHVEDILSIASQIVIPWTMEITAFMKEGKTIEAKSLESAKAQFYEQVGGTPEMIGTLFEKMFRLGGISFHETVAGSTPLIAKVTYHQPTKVLRVYWKHPMG